MRRFKRLQRIGNACFTGFYFILMPVLCLLLFFGALRERTRASEIVMRRRNEASALIQADLPKEALSVLREGDIREDDDASLFFEAALADHRFALAEDILNAAGALQNEAHVEQLVVALNDDKQAAEAWRVLHERGQMVTDEKQMFLATALLQDVEESPLNGQFVAGWFHDGLCILRDDEGFYLARADGASIDTSRYAALVADEKGFIAQKGEVWIRLDPWGKFESVTTPPGELSEAVVQENQWVKVGKKEEGVSFYLGDRDLDFPVYEKVSRVSPLGVAYAFSEGRWSRLRFNALREGGT